MHKLLHEGSDVDCVREWIPTTFKCYDDLTRFIAPSGELSAVLVGPRLSALDVCLDLIHASDRCRGDQAAINGTLAKHWVLALRCFRWTDREHQTRILDSVDKLAKMVPGKRENYDHLLGIASLLCNRDIAERASMLIVNEFLNRPSESKGCDVFPELVTRLTIGLSITED
jgi:hypothetical protein